MTADLSAARTWVERRPLLADAALALVVFAVSVQPLLTDPGCGCPPQPPQAYALVLAQCLPLVWRRRRPFPVAVVTGLLTAAHGLSSVPEPVVAFPGLVAVYSVAAHASRRLALLSGALAGVVITVTLLLDAPYADVQDYTVNYLVFGTAWLLGDSVRTRRERALELEDRIAQEEQLRAVEAERALAEERTRIARELHDVVAHAVSLMVVQAEAGPVVVQREPERAVAAFDAISATGKEALTEMRRLLGVLRTDPAGPLAPQPGLALLPDGPCRPASTCRPTASCRRPSPTPSSTQGRPGPRSGSATTTRRSRCRCATNGSTAQRATASAPRVAATGWSGCASGCTWSAAA